MKDIYGNTGGGSSYRTMKDDLQETSTFRWLPLQ